MSSSHWSMNGAVVVNGRWMANGKDYCVINVYAPCSQVEKEQLWDRILLVLTQREDAIICIIGDFNSIIEKGERVGRGWNSSVRELRDFREFVTKGNLVVVKLQGRQLTWYRSNRSCKSRIDRVLVNEKWVDTWPSSSLKGLPRSVSDHCAIVLC